LPGEATDLKEYLRKYKEKDQSKEFNIEEIQSKAKANKERMSGMVGERLPMWMMADDSLRPKNKT
jgi:hypothetical protein